VTDRPIIDSSSWTGLPSSVRRISDPEDWAHGLTEEQDAQLAADYRRHDCGERLKALRMLWGPAIVDEASTRWRRDGVVDYIRNRGEDWTVWRAIVASLALIMNRRHRQRHVDRHQARTGSCCIPSVDLGFWDSRSDGYGYSFGHLELYPRWRVEVGSDGESFL